VDLQSISYRTPFVANFAFQRLCIPQPPCHFQPSHSRTMASALMSKTALAGQALVGKTRAARPQVRKSLPQSRLVPVRGVCRLLDMTSMFLDGCAGVPQQPGRAGSQGRWVAWGNVLSALYALQERLQIICMRVSSWVICFYIVLARIHTSDVGFSKLIPCHV